MAPSTSQGGLFPCIHAADDVAVPPLRPVCGLHARSGVAEVTDFADGLIVTVARRDIIESYERACEAAGVHAGHRRHRQLQPDQRRARPAAAPSRRLAAGARRRRLQHARGRARQRPDLLPQPRDGAEGAIWPIWCTRRRCITRIGSAAAASRASCSPARRSLGADDGRALRRSLEERLGIAVEPSTSARGVALRDRIAAGAGAARRAGAAGRRRCCRERQGWR